MQSTSSKNKHEKSQNEIEISTITNNNIALSTVHNKYNSIISTHQYPTVLSFI